MTCPHCMGTTFKVLIDVYFDQEGQPDWDLDYTMYCGSDVCGEEIRHVAIPNELLAKIETWLNH